MSEALPLNLLWLLAPLVLLVAGAYASVGLGGGTGYLAIMTLAGLPAAAMIPTALMLNLVVTGVAALRFGLAGRIKWPLFLPFLLPAMPAAFLGGLITADKRIFFALLALALTLAALALLIKAPRAEERQALPERRRLYLIALPAGFAVGLASGFLGIGGGVFLGPLLLFLGWAGPKQVAAMSSTLILILSAVALSAHGLKGAIEPLLMLPLAAAALVGGLIGASLAERKLSSQALQRVFAGIILVAAAKAAYDAVAG